MWTHSVLDSLHSHGFAGAGAAAFASADHAHDHDKPADKPADKPKTTQPKSAKDKK